MRFAVDSVRAARPAVLFLLALCCVISACGGGSSTPSPPPEDPPSITCPAPQTLTSLFATPMQVVYGTPTLAGGTRPVNMTCTPESGATFPIGTTTVTCTATDAKQRTSSCTLTVTVEARAPISLTRFVAFGDSMTAGEDGTTAITVLEKRLASESGQPYDSGTAFTQVLLPTANYPFVLRTALQARYPLQAASITVDNRGNPGELASDVDTPKRFSSEALRGGYQAVLLMEGSNDVNLAVGDSLKRTAALSNIRSMVRSARNANVRPFLATIPPMNPSACSPRCRGIGYALVAGFNSDLRGIASSEGATLVDVYEAFNNDVSLISSDGLHPNVAGYQRIADTFLDVLIATLEQK
jgi:lysophospholipase L1-like esterase